MDTFRLERLMRHIKKQENGCWDWQAFINPGGYGVAFDGVRARVAHRVIYEIVKGAIPQGLTLDHLCRNTRCVNPDHLEAVSMGENARRANGFAGINARKTHCPQGHPYDEENTYSGRAGRYRRCLTCMREQSAALKKGRPRKTHCIRGHEFTTENTRIAAGVQVCKICDRMRQDKYALKKAEKWCALTPDGHMPSYWEKQLILGTCISAQHALATHCPQGHPYDEQNTYANRGRRHCRTCHVERERERRARNKQA